MFLLSLLTSTSLSSSVLLSDNNLAIFMSGALLMAMFTTLVTAKNNEMRLGSLFAGFVGLGLLSGGPTWLLFFVGISFCLNFYQAVTKRNKTLLILTGLALVLFVFLVVSYWFFNTAIFWCVTAILIMLLSDLNAKSEFVVEQQKTAHIPESEPYTDPSPLADFADKQQLRHAFNAFATHSPFKAALVILRLEGFEQVNQHIGRDFGDLLLAQSANRIKDLLGNDEVLTLKTQTKLAHLGGLNFAFICNLQRHTHLHQQLIDSILSAALKPFNVANCTIEVKIRASYVYCNQSDQLLDEYIRCAFLALDSQPSKQVIEYHQHMLIDQQEQQARLSELANIDFTKEFELYFQPIIGNEEGKIEFLELLLRWQHPLQGTLSASRFIDDIKIAGLAYPLAEFVIERAGELAMALRLEGVSTPLSINVFGPEMLNAEFVEFVYGVMSNHQLKPGDLIIECPLHIFTNLDSKGRSMIARLNNMGLKVCVDGLGDNPVLLAKLPNLSVEYIKVSPALTADFSNQNNIRSLVTGMVDMHNQQNTKVIFEGVETLDQLKFVKSLKAYASQGYYFGHPLSSVGLVSWLKQWQQAQQED